MIALKPAGVGAAGSDCLQVLKASGVTYQYLRVWFKAHAPRLGSRSQSKLFTEEATRCISSKYSTQYFSVSPACNLSPHNYVLCTVVGTAWRESGNEYAVATADEKHLKFWWVF